MSRLINNHLGLQNTTAYDTQHTPPAAASPQHHGQMQAQMQHLLSFNSEGFKNTVYRPGLHFMSSDLKKVLIEVKKTQDMPSHDNVAALEKRLDKWQAHHPKEFQARGELVPQLRAEMQTYRNNPLLSARTHQELMQGIKTMHGEQTYATLQRCIPGLREDGPLHHTTLHTMLQVLDSPYFKSFKLAEPLVKGNEASGFDPAALSLVTAELAKLPPPLLKQLQKHGTQIVVTHDSIGTVPDAARHGLSDKTPRGWTSGSTAGLPATFVDTTNTVLISLVKNASNEWSINPDHGCRNLVLHETGHAIDVTLGTKETGQYLSNHQGFQQAWQKDLGLLDDYHRQPGPENDFKPGRQEGFAEGVARAFNDPSTQHDWPNICHYIANVGSALETGNHRFL
ncbi:hypothetical protein QCD60_17605 [Pokkaliibacter sp. MBI-7]|uniref:anthrax toxin lethal factor-related metalloendopeptidase n=1 Tax=Pokkaliibacter sp. MBI-7 TaxID=3040600 RepID=UPI00244B81A7|nr:hypothetical protein [Pokkaliibacter sp. MBI-7]MDH2434378.1 hypothetical protein [Pokkaliibacter sp. MBI-7]